MPDTAASGIANFLVFGACLFLQFAERVPNDIERLLLGFSNNLDLFILDAWFHRRKESAFVFLNEEVNVVHRI